MGHCIWRKKKKHANLRYDVNWGCIKSTSPLTTGQVLGMHVIHNLATTGTVGVACYPNRNGSVTRKALIWLFK